MDNEKRTYTREFKLEVLELLKTSGKSQVQLEREIAILRQERDILKKVVAIFSRSQE